MTINSDARDVKVIKEWPGVARKNEQLDKAPSRIAFAIENEEAASDRWGYDVDASMKSYSWMKLLLDDNALPTEFDSNQLHGKIAKGLLTLPADKTAEDVAAAYLQCMYQHVMDVLTKVYSAEILKVTAIDWWFTVPATWQDAANDATRNAAARAGFGSRKGDELYMITEPEAAAVAILSMAIEKNPGLFKV